MLFNVSGLLKLPPGTLRTYPLPAGEVVALDDTTTLTIDTGQVRLACTNRGLIARGTIQGHVDGQTCSRCLKPMTSRITVTFDEEFLPTIDINRGTPLPGPDDEMIFTIDGNHHLDLTEAVRQNTLALLPIGPVCRPDCAGLCPHCGCNRNDRRCACDDDVDNRPFAILAQLLPAVGADD